MAITVGLRRVENQHRLYDRINILSCMVSSLGIALTYLTTGSAKFQPGDYALVECSQFEMCVRFPIHGPLELSFVGKSPLWIDLHFEERSGPLAMPAPGTVTLAKIIPQIF